jgi:hypothetical protein
MQMAIEIKEIKKEIQSLKERVLFGKDDLIEKRLVSLRGMGKMLYVTDTHPLVRYLIGELPEKSD